MSSTPAIDAGIRNRILSNPESILEDQDVMRALVAANERSMGTNIVDLRGIAMERLEARLDRLEDTHRSVIAAAYENLAGTNQVHRAVLRLLDAEDFRGFLADLSGEVADILRVDAIRLVLESREVTEAPEFSTLEDVLVPVPEGFTETFLTRGKKLPLRQVALRQCAEDDAGLFGDTGPQIRSEACLRLNLGEGRLPGMLVLGAEDPHLFSPQHGTDLLAFFAGVFERLMRRWLG
ncbi:MAG: recombinase XerC [Rhodobacterales bacterium]|nr:MAG: recombinase XerC [Rhodobacterales bacterium]